MNSVTIVTMVKIDNGSIRPQVRGVFKDHLEAVDFLVNDMEEVCDEHASNVSLCDFETMRIILCDDTEYAWNVEDKEIM